MIGYVLSILVTAGGIAIIFRWHPGTVLFWILVVALLVGMMVPNDEG